MNTAILGLFELLSQKIVSQKKGGGLKKGSRVWKVKFKMEEGGLKLA